MFQLRKRTENDLPPEQVRFSDLHVEPWPDGRRVRIHVDITPFQMNPDLEVTITDPQGVEKAHTTIVETAENRVVFTMHLREEVKGSYQLLAVLSYPEIGEVDTRNLSFESYASPSDEPSIP